MILLFTIPSFLAFVLYVEQHALRMRLKAMRCQVYQTWGRVDWVYPSARKQQEWMRSNTIKTYK